ncbi:MAG: hypothetical protein WBQ25_00875 [Nitrososphaeraceae archaeon]
MLERGNVEQRLKIEVDRPLNEFLFSNDNDGINRLTRIVSGYRKCEGVVESTTNMWIRIHDTLEDNGIKTVLANPYKTRIIAEAKVKSEIWFGMSIICSFKGI